MTTSFEQTNDTDPFDTWSFLPGHIGQRVDEVPPAPRIFQPTTPDTNVGVRSLEQILARENTERVAAQRQQARLASSLLEISASPRGNDPAEYFDANDQAQLAEFLRLAVRYGKSGGELSLHVTTPVRVLTPREHKFGPAVNYDDIDETTFRDVTFNAGGASVHEYGYSKRQLRKLHAQRDQEHAAAGWRRIWAGRGFVIGNLGSGSLALCTDGLLRCSRNGFDQSMGFGYGELPENASPSFGETYYINGEGGQEEAYRYMTLEQRLLRQVRNWQQG